MSCSAIEDKPVDCKGESNGAATVTAFGGNGSYTYNWDNGETTATATDLDAGLHTVTVTDSKNCSTTCSITINEPQEDLSCTILELNPVVCKGESNGQATVTPIGGNGGYSYLWDNGVTTATATNLSAGLHTVTVTDSKNCTTTCDIIINEPSNDITCSIMEDNPVVCKGESNGEATVTATGGNGGYTYLWDNGETTAFATALSAGPHTVTITDSKDCTSTCSITINEPDAILTCSAVEDAQVICKGEANGQATVTPVGGNGGYIYLWDNGETTATAIALNVGVHNVTITDSKGCSTNCSITISEPSESLSCEAVEDNPVLCSDEANGEATVTPIGGNGGYTYLWDNGETTATAISLIAGIHTVTVTDDKNCTSICQVEITQPDSRLECTAEQDEPVNCKGEANGQATVKIKGGNGGDNILWDNGETTKTAVALDAGFHTVTVIDRKGCETQCIVLIEEPEFHLTCNASEDNPVVCRGESNGEATVTPAGGNDGYTYLWDNGETTATAVALDAGTHTVVVTDSKNCTTSCSITINEPSAELTCSAIEINPVVCMGESNGEATVTPAGGNSGYTYLWDNGETTATATTLDAGIHTVVVTDSKDCTTSCTITINEPSEILTCTATEINPVICKGEANGEATVIPTGGNAGYTYLWDNGETTATATALDAGSHTVVVTDSKNCTTSCTITINEPSEILTCSATETNPVVCNGESNGEATVTPSGGNGGYTYLWDNGETTATAAALDAGVHTVVVTDSKDCTTTCTVTINEPEAELTCSASEDSPVVCNGESNGQATVTPDGGNGGYTFLWDNGETTASATALDAGLHTVTITDSKDCTTTCTVTINEPEAELTCSASEDSPVVCNGESNGQATVTPDGGNGGYTFLWDNGETTATATDLDAGLHTVTVTDSKDCTTTCTVTINEPEAELTCSASEDSPVVCNGESNGQATVTPDGGNGGYTFLWDNGETTATATALDAGLHTVTVTDSKDCTTTCQVEILQPDAAVSCTVDKISDVDCFGEATGSATVNPLGGNGGYIYAWDNGETTQTAIALEEGIHTVLVTDSKGCSSQCTIEIGSPEEAISCEVSVAQEVLCNMPNSGSAVVTASGGTPGYTYLWDNGETTATAISLNVGLHFVTITDANNCEHVCSIDVNEAPPQCTTIFTNGFNRTNRFINSRTPVDLTNSKKPSSK